MLACGFIALGLTFAAGDVLCERTAFVKLGAKKGYATFRQLESADADRPTGIYGLSAVTVPPDGWVVDAVTIFATVRDAKRWATLDRARLNVFPKGKGDAPSADDDPRKGREVKVTVRELPDGVCAIRAAGLGLKLAPGDHWVGLTPICDFKKHGQGFHLHVNRVRDARFDDAALSPDGDRGAIPFLKSWTPLGPRLFSPPDEHLAVRIEGTRLHRGRIVEGPAVAPAKQKTFHLRFATFDPLEGTPKVPAELQAAPAGRLFIVQARAAVDQPLRDALTGSGAVVLRYIPDDAYLVRMAPDAVAKVRDLKAIRWVGPYHPAYRIDAAVWPEPANDSFGRLIPKGEPAGVRRVRVYLFDGAAEVKKAVAQAVRDAGGEVLYTSARGKYLVAHVPLKKLGAVAGRDEVCAVERLVDTIEPAQITRDIYGGPKARITMAQVRELCGADRLKADGFEGLGVRVAFWDDGIRTDHVDLLTRPITLVGPRPMRANFNHGTAIAGILAGDGRGNPKARGLLPLGALLFATRPPEYEPRDGYQVLDAFVNEHRAAVMSDSSGGWGGQKINHYEGLAAILDEWVLTHDLTYCVAIGNGSPRNGHTGSWAKNVVHVGGVHPHGSVRREDHRPLSATTGPAADGRVKPDLVHFGYGVYTIHASGPREYENFAGTSCATPVTAGHFGLMMEAWAAGAFGNHPPGRTVTDRKPHAATAKALMINSAYRYPLDGPKPAFTRAQQGWGMADLGRLWDVRGRLFVVDQELPLRGGQAVEYRLRVDAKQPELRVTLAYSDPPAETTAAKALVNDLDLTLTAPDGTVYRGNVGLTTANTSTSGGEPDRVNNVESVFLPAPAPGVWRVTVSAQRVAIDQHARTAAWDQDFGLVVTGAK